MSEAFPFVTTAPHQSTPLRFQEATHDTHIGLLLHAMACKNIIQRSANQTHPLPGSRLSTPILPKPLLYICVPHLSFPNLYCTYVYHTYPSQTSTVCVPHLSFPNLYCMCTTPILPKPLLYICVPHLSPSQTSTVHMCTTPILPKPLLYVYHTYPSQTSTVCVPHLSFPNLYRKCSCSFCHTGLLEDGEGK